METTTDTTAPLVAAPPNTWAPLQSSAASNGLIGGEALLPSEPFQSMAGGPISGGNTSASDQLAAPSLVPPPDRQIQDVTGAMDVMGVNTGNPRQTGKGKGRSKASGIKNKDDNKGKLFVGGLSLETNKERLVEYFMTFGAVQECVVMCDPATHRSRGFGFITFVDPKACEVVMGAGPHMLDGHPIDPKPAIARGSRSNRSPKPQKQDKSPHREYMTKKIFVGGLATDTTQELLTTFFADYGKVENVTLMFDRETKRPRGFGFVTFSSEEPVVKLCKLHFVELAGKMVEIKMAQPRATSVDGRRVQRAANSVQGGVTAGYQYGYNVPQQGYGNPYAHVTQAQAQAQAAQYGQFAGQQGYAYGQYGGQNFVPRGGPQGGYGYMPNGQAIFFPAAQQQSAETSVKPQPGVGVGSIIPGGIPGGGGSDVGSGSPGSLGPGAPIYSNTMGAAQYGGYAAQHCASGYPFPSGYAPQQQQQQQAAISAGLSSNTNTGVLELLDYMTGDGQNQKTFAAASSQSMTGVTLPLEPQSLSELGGQ